MKTCTKCQQEKPMSEFHRDAKLGHKRECKTCRKAMAAEHYAKNAELLKARQREKYLENPERFAQFATNVFDIPCYVDFEKTALAGIEAMEDFFRSIKMPTSLRELGLDLSEKQIHELAFKCSFEDTRTIGVFKQLNMKDMEKIYLAAR